MGNPLIQGTPEWLDMRRNYIGASEAATVMGISPWKTPYQLWQEKLGLGEPDQVNFAMQRGLDLEPLARAAFEEEVEVDVFPEVLFHKEHDFMLASLDGVSLDGKTAVELKCPGAKSHNIALGGLVPDNYYPQLQHQLAVMDIDMIYYFSFDGEENAIIEVRRDDEYIAKLIKAEKEFWEHVKSGTPPPLTDKDYKTRNNFLWESSSERLMDINNQIKALTDEKESIRLELIQDADGHSCKGHGLTLFKTFPKGSVNYKSIPELKDVDLNKYRKKSKERWTLRTN